MASNPNNTLELPPDLVAFAQHQVEAGRYKSVADGVRDAFGFLQGRDEKVEKLRAALDEGIAELDAGKGEVVEPGEFTADIRKELGLPPNT